MMTDRNVGRFRLVLLGLASLAVLSGCGDDRFPDYRYKMTIMVTTPEGEKSFSSVRQVRQEETDSIQDSSGRKVKTDLEGEAVILDLAGGRTVYALLFRPDSPEYAHHIAGAALLPMIRKPERGEHDDLTSDLGGYLDRQAAEQQIMIDTVGPHELPRERTTNAVGVPLDKPFSLWPMFVTFDDPAKPATVRQVSPQEIGVSRITIAITDEPVTAKIEDRLAWLDSYDRQDKRLSGNSSIAITSNALVENLGTGAFRQEMDE